MSTKDPTIITEDRILQISNNVSEEYADLGQTNFATKAELCQTIEYWRNQADANFERFNILRMSLQTLALTAMLSDIPNLDDHDPAPDKGE